MRGAWRTPLALLVLTAGCAGITRWQAAKTEPSAPALEGRDLQGRWVRAEEYRGRVVLVEVWKSG